MTSAREATITAAVRATFPTADLDAIVAALRQAAKSDVALAHIDKHLAAYPDALSSGHSNAPPPVVRFAAALQEVGLKVKVPVCGKCGRSVRLPYKMGDERWCVTCYSHTTKIICVTCGKEKKIGARTPEGPICQHCVRKSKPEPCVTCGRVRPVTTRNQDGPRCNACSPRPEYDCSVCGNRRPAQTMVDGLAVCAKCYKQPQRTCGICGQEGVITLAATNTTPDVCTRCYTAPLKPCPDCGVRTPCEHDSEYFMRPGNEHAGPMDAETLARRRRMAPRAVSRCARCQRDRPAQAVWPMGPVCNGCYDAVLRRPAECPACGTLAALIGRIDDEQVCGPCAGSDRTYQCRKCGQPARAVADATCPRCYAQDEFDRILTDASDAWEPLRHLPQDTDSPMALVAWLRRSRGASLLENLIAGGQTPQHADLPAGKAEHYLRSLLVEADILEARIEPLERLTDWVDELVRDDLLDTQQIVRRFAQWHVLRRARRRSGHRVMTEASGKWARQQVTVARDFIEWLAQHDATLAECSQALIDLWLASGNTRRYLVRDFISWAKKDGLVDKGIKVPVRVVKEPTIPIEEQDRWALLRDLLADEAVPDETRVAGTLVLLYGQHLSRVVALRPSAVRNDGNVWRITVAGTPLPVPDVLGEPLGRLTSPAPRGKSAISRTTASRRWLFPGGNPGQHITVERMRRRLADRGITLRVARHAALLQWAQDTPGPILAAALGLHINTAVAWRDAVQADYTEFVAARVSEAERR